VTTRPSRVVRTIAALAVAAGLVVTFIPSSSYADPQPTLAQVEARLNDLQNQAEAANEAALGAKVALAQGQLKLNQINARVKTGEAALAALRGSIGELASAAYRSGGLDQTLQLLLSNNASDFLAQASVLDGLSRHQADVLRMQSTAAQRLAQDKLAAAQQVGILQQLRDKATKEQAVVEQKVAAQQQLLNSLQAKVRAELAARQTAARAAAAAAAAAARAAYTATVSRSYARSTPTYTSATVSGGSGLGAQAAAWALSQVGHRYVYGAAGPSAFDCSGLTMSAYRSVGIYLPHFSGAQWGAGRHISASQLQPGDLVFYYSPSQHVGMYIGGGRIVEAANPSAGVKVSGLYSMPFVGAVRPY
jgi:cell wall-associated NlpC family hydrolase